MEIEQLAGCCLPDAARDIHACGTESYEPPRKHAWHDLQAHPSSSIVSAGKNALDVAQDVVLAMLHGSLQLLDVGRGHGCRDVGAIDEGDLTCNPASLMGIARQLEFNLLQKRTAPVARCMNTQSLCTGSQCSSLRARLWQYLLIKLLFSATSASGRGGIMLALQQLGRSLRLTVRMPHCRYTSGADVQVQKIAAFLLSTDTSS